MKLFFTFLFCTTLSAIPLDMSRGKLTLGGSASIPVLIDRNNNFSIALDLKPRLGGFLIEYLTLEGMLSINLPINREKAVIWGFGTVAQYFFDLGANIYPYLGLGLEFEFVKKEFRDMAIYLPFGILVGLNEYVALDIGIPIKLHIPNYDFGLTLIEIPFGYYGLRAFF